MMVPWTKGQKCVVCYRALNLKSKMTTIRVKPEKQNSTGTTCRRSGTEKRIGIIAINIVNRISNNPPMYSM